MEIAGLPAHPLIVHAAVVFTPLAVLGALVFAVLPRWRYLSRWPTAALAVVAVASIWASRISGSSMVDANPSLRKLVETHEHRAETLSLIAIGFTVVVLAGTFLLGGPSGLVSGRGGRAMAAAWLERSLPVAIVLVAVVTAVWTVLTGDAGARAVWG